MLGSRDLLIGNDTKAYEYYFLKISSTPWNQLTKEIDLEIGFTLLNKLISLITPSFRIFLFITSIICVVPLYLLYSTESESPLVSILIFSNIPIMILLFSGIRQSIALSLVALAYVQFKKKRYLISATVFMISLSFHLSSIIALIMLLCYFFKITRKTLVVLAPGFAIVFAFRAPIYTFALRIMGGKYYEKYANVGNTNAFNFLFLLIALTVFCFIIMDENLMTRDDYALRNMLVLALFIQIFASVSPLIMRFNYYPLMLIPLLIPRVSRVPHAKLRVLSIVATASIALFFLVYFFFAGYSGIDPLNTIPYMPFWAV